MTHSSEVGLEVSTIAMLIVAARRSIRQLIAVKVVPLDITPHHYWMLMLMYLHQKPMSLGELARAMWMDNPTVSRMVQQMGTTKGGRGFLHSDPHPTHGRRIHIKLTPEGLLLCSEKLLQIGNDDLLGVGLGVGPGLAQLLGGPKAQQLVAAGVRLEAQLLVMRELLLEGILALVERAHGPISQPRRTATGGGGRTTRTSDIKPAWSIFQSC